MRLDRAKFPECLIEAIAPLDARLLLIGQGELEGALHRLIAKLGVGDRVEFIPQVPNSEIQTYYQQADVFAMATHYEGFCIPVLEAMAAGLPVVASSTAPIPEVLGDTGLIVNNEPAAFTRALASLQQDPEHCRVLGAAARKRAEDLDGKFMEEREAKLYEVLMDGRQGELEDLLSDSRRFVN